MDWFLYENGLRHERVKIPPKKRLGYVSHKVRLKSIFYSFTYTFYLYLYKKAYFKKNSVLQKVAFVSDSIKELVVNELIAEARTMPHVAFFFKIPLEKSDFFLIEVFSNYICTGKVKFDNCKFGVIH